MLVDSNKIERQAYVMYSINKDIGEKKFDELNDELYDIFKPYEIEHDWDGEMNIMIDSSELDEVIRAYDEKKYILYEKYGINAFKCRINIYFGLDYV